MGEVREIEKELTDEEYEEFLDELCEPIQIGALTYSPGHVLREIDPIAFNVGKADYEGTSDSVWECLGCGEQHDYEDDARDCCD